MKRFNWPLWTGLVLSVIAFMTYFSFFARFPITRDIPWVNVLLFIAATAMLIAGVRRSSRKIVPSIVAVLGIGVFAFFVVAVTAGTKLPAAPGAPRIG